MTNAIKVENLSKRYKLGLTHAGSVRELVNRAALKLLRRNRVPQLAANEDSSRVDSEGMFWALREVNFEIPQGSAIGIIGRNGAGKSTLLKIFSRITQPTSGRITMRGRVASLLEVGTGFHPELTGRENVYLNGTILGMSRKDIRQRFDAIVQFAGIDKFIDTPVKRYSSGMTVRLGFAVAAHLEPEILVVDEVLAVGDIEFQQRCLGKMDEVASSGRTVLFVSHNMSTVRQLTTDSIVMHQGRVSYYGETKEAIERYTALNRSESVHRANIGRRQANDLGEIACFQSIKFLREDTFFEVDEPVGLEVAILSRKFTGKMRLSFTLLNSNRSPIGSVFSAESISLEEGAVARVIVELDDLRLAPGSYFMAMSIGTGDNHTGFRDFDSVTDVLHFDVVSPTLDNGGIATWKSGWGTIRFPAPTIRSVNLYPITATSALETR